jgi:hypothetical protein
MTSATATPATLDDLLLDLEQRRIARIEQRRRREDEFQRARDALAEAKRARDLEISVAVDKDRPPRLTAVNRRIAKLTVEADPGALARDRQRLAAHVEQLNTERLELLRAHRPELIERALATSALADEKMLLAARAIEDAVDAVGDADTAWQLAFAGQPPLGTERVGSLVSDPNRPLAAFNDALAIATQPTAVGGLRKPRHRLRELLAELAAHLRSVSCLPAGYVAGADNGNGTPGQYRSNVTGQTILLDAEQLRRPEIARRVAVSEDGFSEWRRVRALTADDELEMCRLQRLQALSSPGYVAAAARDSVNVERGVGVLLDPDADDQPFVKVFG